MLSNLRLNKAENWKKIKNSQPQLKINWFFKKMYCIIIHKEERELYCRHGNRQTYTSAAQTTR